MEDVLREGYIFIKCANPNCKDLLIRHGIRVVLNDIIDWCLREEG